MPRRGLTQTVWFVAVLVVGPALVHAEPHRPRVAVLEEPRASRMVPVDPLGATEVATMYATVGRQLKALTEAKGSAATIDLWPRYRWIRINEAIATADKRFATAQLLQRLLADIRAQ